MTSGAAERRLAVVRLVWGAVLLAWPAGPATVLGDRTPTAVTVLRLLGLRHVVQALVTLRAPTRRVAAAGAAVDAAHAASAVAFALWRREHRAVLIDAAIAGAWSIAGAAQARRAAPTPA